MIYLLLFIALSTGSWVFIHELQQVMPTNVSLLLSTVFAIILFHAINYKHIGTMYRVLLQSKMTYVMLMVCTLVMWASSFFVSSVSPTFSMFTQMGIGAALGSLSLLKEDATMENRVSAYAISGVILASLGYLCMNFSPSDVLYALGIISIVSFFDFYYSHISHKINQLGLTSSQVVAGRFWILLIVSLVLQSSDLRAEFFSTTNILITLGVAIFTFILPIYTYQKSVATMGPDFALIGSGVLPLTTFIAEKAFTVSKTPMALGVLSLMLTLAIMLPPLYFKYKRSLIERTA